MLCNVPDVRSTFRMSRACSICALLSLFRASASTKHRLHNTSAMDIGDYLKEDVDIIETSLGDATAVHQSTIKIDRAYQQLVLVDREIVLAVEKRFKGKRTLYGSPDFKDIISWCLATNGYKVSSTHLVNVSDDDVGSAWQFIDTMSVSSTARCRELINRGKGGRTGVGFSRSRPKREIVKPVAQRGRTGVLMKLPPIQVELGREISSEHDTIDELITDDCMRWVSMSTSPMEAYFALCRDISDRHQGI